MKFHTKKSALTSFSLSGIIKNDLQKIKELFKLSNDLIAKQFKLLNREACLFFINGLNDIEAINECILNGGSKSASPKDFNMNFVLSNIIVTSESEVESDLSYGISEVLKGKALLIIDGLKEFAIFGVDKFKERAITEPPTSAVLKGPRGGFVENIKTNISLIRKILSTTDLVFEHFNVGKYTQTQVSVFYISSIADKKIVNEIKKRIQKINIDGIIDSFYISQFLEYYPKSMFKQVGSCEKADIACAKILEGRVGILVDGSPIALTLPYLLIEDLQTSGDYFSDHSHSTFLRYLRIFSFLITLMLPGMYIAIELHHYKIIPLKFIITIMNTTQQLPLSPFVEIVFVLLLFEVLYEASLRMPRYLGLALSIVGALILGDTAAKAGLVSPPSVMIVALSGITLYTLPDISQQLSLLRILFTVAGGCMGFFGIVVLIMFLLFHLNDFDAYGVAYFAPISPLHVTDLKDAIHKSDLTSMFQRPTSIKNKNKTRQKNKSNT